MMKSHWVESLHYWAENRWISHRFDKVGDLLLTPADPGALEIEDRSAWSSRCSGIGKPGEAGYPLLSTSWSLSGIQDTGLQKRSFRMFDASTKGLLLFSLMPGQFISAGDLGSYFNCLQNSNNRPDLC